MDTSDAPNRNVFILGAGFSAEAGAPVINDFFDRAREFYDNPNSRLDSAERQQFRSVLDFRREMAAARGKIDIDLDNIEDLFGLVEISNRLGSADPETRDNTVYLIAKTLELATNREKRSTIGFDLVEGERDPFITSNPAMFSRIEGANHPFRADIYHFFAALVAGVFDPEETKTSRSDTIITFNYDLVFDDALTALGFSPEYHLDRDLVTYTDEWKAGNSITVLKLHGSTNWGICTSPSCGGSVAVLPPSLKTSPAQYRRLSCKVCGERLFHPLLVPPSWDKTDYRDVIRPVWRKAVEEITKATRVCIIGYSMPLTDAFFRYLITLGLSRNENLYKLVAVDLNRDAEKCELNRKYDKLLTPMFNKRRFTFYSNGFKRFLVDGTAASLLGRGEKLSGRLGLY